MIREVELVSYLPEFMQSYNEPVETLKAENPEFAIMWKAVDRVLCNRFIATADEYGISHFEKLLDIYPNETDTLTVRKMRVQNRWFNRLPYTMKIFVNKLIEILGEESNFCIQSDFKYTYEMLLILYQLDYERIEEIKYILLNMLPINLVTNISYECRKRTDIYFGAVLCEGDILQMQQRQVQ